MRLYTLGSRGSWELKTFLKIRLISSRINQKLKNKGEIHGFLKRILAQNRGQLVRSWKRFAGVVGAVPLGDVVASGLAWNKPQFCFKRATIAPRSGHDRELIVISIFQWMPSDDRGGDSAMKESWSRLDRTAIVVRSRHDRGLLPRVFPAVRWRSRPYENLTRQRVPRSFNGDRLMAIHRPMKRPPSAGDLTLHASPRREEDRASSWPSDRDRAVFIWWRSGDSPNATCPKVSPKIASTYSIFYARVPLMIAWTRVHAIIIVPTTSDDCPAAT